jgi:hypothetical protein
VLQPANCLPPKYCPRSRPHCCATHTLPYSFETMRSKPSCTDHHQQKHTGVAKLRPTLPTHGHAEKTIQKSRYLNIDTQEAPTGAYTLRNSGDTHITQTCYKAQLLQKGNEDIRLCTALQTPICGHRSNACRAVGTAGCPLTQKKAIKSQYASQTECCV